MYRFMLIEKATGREITKNETITSFNGETAYLLGFTPPHKPSSSGRVHVLVNGATLEFFPSVYGLEIIRQNEN